MSTSVSLQEPFSYSLELLLLLIGLAILPLIVMFLVKLLRWGKAVAPKKKEVQEEKKEPVDKEKVRSKYLNVIDGLEKQYKDQKIDDRAAYLGLSEAVRNFVHEFTGMNTQNLTLNEIGELGLPSLYNLIKDFYRPEFAYDSGDTDVDQSFEISRKVVRTWN